VHTHQADGLQRGQQRQQQPPQHSQQQQRQLHVQLEGSCEPRLSSNHRLQGAHIQAAAAAETAEEAEAGAGAGAAGPNAQPFCWGLLSPGDHTAALTPTAHDSAVVATDEAARCSSTVLLPSGVHGLQATYEQPAAGQLPQTADGAQAVVVKLEPGELSLHNGCESLGGAHLAHPAAAAAGEGGGAAGQAAAAPADAMQQHSPEEPVGLHRWGSAVASSSNHSSWQVHDLQCHIEQVHLHTQVAGGATAEGQPLLPAPAAAGHACVEFVVAPRCFRAVRPSMCSDAGTGPHVAAVVGGVAGSPPACGSPSSAAAAALAMPPPAGWGQH
jgi:hypothetical protein